MGVLYREGALSLHAENFLEVCVCHRILASSWHYFGTEMWQQSQATALFPSWEEEEEEEGTLQAFKKSPLLFLLRFLPTKIDLYT